MIEKIKKYFTRAELILWFCSVTLIALSFLIFDRGSYLTLAASLIGVSAILVNAKGNPIGQLLIVIFSIMYGVISYSFAYYGEMITYLGMTMPMAILALISWLKNPFEGKRSEVKVNRLGGAEYVIMTVLTVFVTAVFYFILSRLGTANIIPSTLSVATSFAAVYLTFRRSPLFSLFYAANDVVLIILWVLASLENSGYVSVVACFFAFFANDVYAFVSWRRMERRQSNKTE